MKISKKIDRKFWLKFIFAVFVLFFASNLSFGASNSVGVGATVVVPVTSVPGCTDPTANNYNSLATVDNGTCTYTHIGGSVLGCMNPSASNYNSNATVDDGSCILIVPPVRNFRANYIKNRDGIVLTWLNPVGYYFYSIRILKSLHGYPTSPFPVSGSSLIYEGVGEETVDQNVVADQRYYYTAFVRSQTNTYSLGVPATEIFSVSVEPVRGCMNPSASNYNPNATVDDGSCPGGTTEVTVRGCTNPNASNYNPQANTDDGSCLSVGTTSPFDLLPKVTEPSGLTWDLLFIQPKETEKTFDKSNQVDIYGEKNLTIKFNAQILPDVLKTVGVTIYDPDDPTRSFSFLLKENYNRTAYLGTIEPLLKNGTYPISLFIINYQDQTIRHIKGELLVAGAKVAFNLIPFLGTVVPPLVAVGLLPSLYELFLVITRALSYLFGYRKKSKPWGTVYDSITKRPLDPAYVTIWRDGKEISSAITDIDGRFGFFLSAGNYSLQANKTHYKFPSTTLAGRLSDEVYDNLYFGGQVTVKEGEVVNLNIPMDPVGFDWNEFAKNKKDYFRFYSRRERIKVWILDSVFYLGFALSVGIFIAEPSILNAVFCSFYLAFEIFRTFWRYRHKAGQIISASTGEPLAYGLVRVYLPVSNQLVKIVPADELGRYYVLVRPGTYYYTVEEKQIDGSYVKIYQSGLVDLPKGVLTEKIIIK